MQPGTDKILAKALAAAAAARRDLARGAFDLAAARSFYALLHAARALLNERGMRTRVHSEVSAALHGVAGLPAELADFPRRFDDALRLRRATASGEAPGPTETEVERWVDGAALIADGAARLIGFLETTEGERRVRGDESHSGQ